MSQRVVIGLETQVPYHNPRVVTAFIDFIAAYQPTRVVGIGDHLDCPAPARWNRGTAAEYAGNLQAEVNTMKGIFERIRNVFDGDFGIHEGNHEKRIDVYARTKAPAFADLDCLRVASLLEYNRFGITELPPIARLAPGWVTTHGDLGSLARYAGGTAISLARRLGVSVVCGHTHRLGHIRESYAVGAKTIIHGIETGHMMDVKKAAYIASGAPNWQAGFAVFDITDSGKVHAQLVDVSPTGRIDANLY